MTHELLTSLLREAFEAGIEYGKSQQGGTIDELYTDNGADFDTWYNSKFPLTTINQYSIGDTVKVIDPGEVCSTYHAKFVQLGFKNPYDEHQFPGYIDPSYKNVHCTIFGLIEYDNGRPLAAIENEDGQYLITLNGIEKV